MNDDITGHNFKGHQGSLEEEEVVARSNTERLVDIATGETDKWRRYGKICDHFRQALGGVSDMYVWLPVIHESFLNMTERVRKVI